MLPKALMAEIERMQPGTNIWLDGNQLRVRRVWHDLWVVVPHYRPDRRGSWTTWPGVVKSAREATARAELMIALKGDLNTKVA